MRWNNSTERKIQQIKRTTLFPSIRLSNHFKNNNNFRSQIEMSLDQRDYRKTSKNIFNKIISKNESQLDYLRKTFLKQNNEDKFKKTIGKGGFAQVYQVEDNMKKKYAMKQYSLVESSNCFFNEIKVGQIFFENGKVKQIFKQNEQIKNVVVYYDKFRLGKFGYIVQQLCNNNLSKMISEIQGVFHNNQRIYQVKFKQFYKYLSNQNGLKLILLSLCKSIQLLNQNGLIHCDLKLQNIMINFIQQQPIIKIIDFGSTFVLSQGLPKITITPEYMPPQLLKYLQGDYNNSDILDKIDVWSVGCILLQILTGIPLWFRYKCKLQMKGKQVINLGIFALSGRQYSKIIRKQKQLSQSINKINFTSNNFQKFRPILKLMLTFDFVKRPTMQKIINLLQKLN